MPAKESREIQLKTDSGEIDVFLCPDPNTSSTLQTCDPLLQDIKPFFEKYSPSSTRKIPSNYNYYSYHLLFNVFIFYDFFFNLSHSAQRNLRKAIYQNDIFDKSTLTQNEKALLNDTNNMSNKLIKLEDNKEQTFNPNLDYDYLIANQNIVNKNHRFDNDLEAVTTTTANEKFTDESVINNSSDSQNFDNINNNCFKNDVKLYNVVHDSKSYSSLAQHQQNLNHCSYQQTQVKLENQQLSNTTSVHDVSLEQSQVSSSEQQQHQQPTSGIRNTMMSGYPSLSPELHTGSYIISLSLFIFASLLI